MNYGFPQTTESTLIAPLVRPLSLGPYGYQATIPICPCNQFDYAGSGGIKVGGSAIVVCTPNRYNEVGSGGVVVGGRAIVNVATQLYDAVEAYYPLQESENGTLGEVIDVAHGLDGQGGGGDPTECPTLDDIGVACENSQLFSGRQFIALPNGTANRALTVSVWTNINSMFAPRCFYSRGTASPSFVFGHTFLRQLTAIVQVVIAGETMSYYVIGKTMLTANKWFYVSCVFDPIGSLSVFIDGVLDGSTTFPAGVLASTTDGNNIGDADNGQFFIGNLQELRVEAEVRSAAWLAAEYASYCSGSFYSLGSETSG